MKNLKNSIFSDTVIYVEIVAAGGTFREQRPVSLKTHFAAAVRTFKLHELLEHLKSYLFVLCIENRNREILLLTR